MAEFLVLVHDVPGREVGDIICAAPDGFAWGGMEHLDPGDGSSFLVVRVDIPFSAARDLVIPLTRWTLDGEMNACEEVVCGSRYMIDLNKYLDYDTFAWLYVADWKVPELPLESVIDKAS